MPDLAQLRLQVEPDHLTELVADLLGCEQCSPGDLHMHAMRVPEDIGYELFHLYGSAQTGSEIQPWSLVLKIVHPPVIMPDTPQEYIYWKREPLLYLGGILANLPDGLAAPRCYEVTQQPDGSIWMWMDEVRDKFNRHWPLEYYQTAARCLGRFNGAFLGDRPLPQHNALAVHGLRNALQNASSAVDILASCLDQPLMHRALPDVDQDFIKRVWQERLEILDILEQFPETFCYLNASRRNLFAWQSASGQEQLIGVDWAYAGLAPAGIEIAPLLYESVAGFGGWGIPSPIELTRLLTEGYLDGLSESGKVIIPTQVQFACLSAMFWRYMLAHFAQRVLSQILASDKYLTQAQEQWADRIAATHPPFQQTYQQILQLKASL